LNHDGIGDIPFRPMKIFSLWVGRYPELVALLQSPVIEFLEVAERIFPVLTPKTMQDQNPRMKPVPDKA
jgi:nitrous oxidase accessory protein